MEKFIPYEKLSKKSTRLIRPGGRPGAKGTLLHGSLKTARHITETKPGIGSVIITQTNSGLFL